MRPTREGPEAEWWGLRKGRVFTRLPFSLSKPATEWIWVTSRASKSTPVVSPDRSSVVCGGWKAHPVFSTRTVYRPGGRLAKT